MIQNIRKNEFESLIKSSKPVLADFYAEWCSPCRMLSPVIEEIGDKFGLTRERVRQIKEKAIRRLRQSNRSKLLKSYLG